MRKRYSLDNAFIEFKPHANRLNENVSWEGGSMPQVENVQQSAHHCFDLARASASLEEDIAVEAFDLLTASEYDGILAHALGLTL